MNRIILIVLLIMLTASSALGQTIYSYQKGESDPAFKIDYSQFFDSEKDISRLEIYYQVYNSDLLFIKDGENFRADYSFTVSIYDRDNVPITNQSREKEFVVSQYIRTMSSSDFRTGQMNFDLPPGKYKVNCHLSDDNSGSIQKKSLDLEIKEYNRRNPQLSGIEFVFAADTVIYDTTFLKRNMTIIPNVGRLYGEDTTSMLNYYFEIYQGKDSAENIHIETRILDRKLNTVYTDTMTANFDHARIAQFRQVAMRNLKSDNYNVEIILKGRRGRPVDNIKESFVIHWSPEAMILNDYETAIQQLRYIASSNEIEAMKKLTESRERLRAWHDFWGTHDPSPGTEENETKIGYYRRIEFADRHFTVMKREGWRTDRGMIYIIYGEPDQIEDYPFELNRKAYQVWHYYHAGSQRREFLFIDEWGNNDFVLQYPYDGVRY